MESSLCCCINRIIRLQTTLLLLNQNHQTAKRLCCFLNRLIRLQCCSLNGIIRLQKYFVVTETESSDYKYTVLLTKQNAQTTKILCWYRTRILRLQNTLLLLKQTPQTTTILCCYLHISVSKKKTVSSGTV